MRGICVGMGRRGRSWFKWAQAAGLEVVGVVDINRNCLDEACDDLEIPRLMRFQSIGDAVKATRAKVATVCAANPDHLACLLQCLDAGVNVIIEKPMVETLKDANTILEKTKETGLKIAVAQNYRYSTEMLAMRKALQEGEIGKVVSVNVTFHRWRPTEGLFLPLLMNQAIHHFDGLRWVLDADPEWCFARSFNPDWNTCDGPTVVEAVYGFSNGVLATYSGSYVSQGINTSYSGLWRIEGSTGQLSFAGSDKDNPVLLSRRDPESQEEIPQPGSELDAPAQVCKAFLDALEGETLPPTDSTDNIKSLAMCWAADLSSREDRLVKIEELI